MSGDDVDASGLVILKIQSATTCTRSGHVSAKPAAAQLALYCNYPLFLLPSSSSSGIPHRPKGTHSIGHVASNLPWAHGQPPTHLLCNDDTIEPPCNVSVARILLLSSDPPWRAKSPKVSIFCDSRQLGVFAATISHILSSARAAPWRAFLSWRRRRSRW